ncbi:MAG: hypothetical protein U1A16_00930 [Patescibacteria group bacterium]|nr:hypothetical protein [Patescibacteria group bacterium]
MLVAPYGGTYIPLEQKESGSIALAFVLQGDEHAGGTWWASYLRQPPLPLTFFPDHRLLVFRRDVAYGPNGKALLLLRQAHQVRDFMAQPYNWQDSRVLTRKMHAAHLFLQRVVTRFGGRRYKEMVRNRVEQLRAETSSEHPEIDLYRTLLSRITGDETMLDEVFGKAHSFFEQQHRRSNFELHAAFQILEELRAEWATEAQVLLMHLLHLAVERKQGRPF